MAKQFELYAFYEQLLYKISQFEVGDEFDVSYLEYHSYISQFTKAIKDGYIQRVKNGDLFAPSFIVIKKPAKYYGEEYINSYFG